MKRAYYLHLLDGILFSFGFLSSFIYYFIIKVVFLQSTLQQAIVDRQTTDIDGLCNAADVQNHSKISKIIISYIKNNCFLNVSRGFHGLKGDNFEKKKKI